MTSMPISEMTAIETKRGSLSAFRDWEKLFVATSEDCTPTCYWNESIGVAGIFYDTTRKEKKVFWTAFARSSLRFRQRLLVEVNPPHSGIDKRFQGVFASDAEGKRYVLHRGSLHPGRTRISSEEFFTHATVETYFVSFSDGSIARCALVAPLDQGEDACADALGQFVSDCASMRDRLSGIDSSNIEKRVRAFEKLMPELRGSFVVPGRGQTTGLRSHAEVWQALKTAVAEIGLAPSNARLGRHGPDLYSQKGSPLVLFEIKVSADNASLQQGLGQLLIYGDFIGGDVLKVLVLPARPANDVAQVLERLQIRFLYFGNPLKPKFDISTIKALVHGSTCL